MEKIIGIKNENYIEIDDQKSLFYGGRQGWWRDTKKKLSDYGCGVIAMTDTELYTSGHLRIDKDSYVNLIEKNFKCKYHYLIARGVPVYKLVIGMLFHTKKFTFWAPHISKKRTYSCIYNMLANDLPVPASYFVFFKKHGLPLYRQGANNSLMHTQSIRSHYFVITGIYLDENSHKKYLCISSWGERYFILYDQWIKKLSFFSNILYYKAKKNKDTK